MVVASGLAPAGIVAAVDDGLAAGGGSADVTRAKREYESKAKADKVNMQGGGTKSMCHACGTSLAGTGIGLYAHRSQCAEFQKNHGKNKVKL